MRKKLKLVDVRKIGYINSIDKVRKEAKRLRR